MKLTTINSQGVPGPQTIPRILAPRQPQLGSGEPQKRRGRARLKDSGLKGRRAKTEDWLAGLETPGGIRGGPAAVGDAKDARNGDGAQEAGHRSSAHCSSIRPQPRPRCSCAALQWGAAIARRRYSGARLRPAAAGAGGATAPPAIAASCRSRCTFSSHPFSLSSFPSLSPCEEPGKYAFPLSLALPFLSRTLLLPFSPFQSSLPSIPLYYL